MVPWKGVLKFVAHGRRTLQLVQRYGWRPAARYTNMRDVRGLPFKNNGFLDIHWKRYDFGRHLELRSAAGVTLCDRHRGFYVLEQT